MLNQQIFFCCTSPVFLEIHPVFLCQIDFVHQKNIYFRPHCYLYLLYAPYLAIYYNNEAPEGNSAFGRYLSIEVIYMIERLINLERPCEETEYHKLTEQIIQLKQRLCGQLNQRGREQLNQLTDLYLEQSAILQGNAFIDGFCAAVDLAADCLIHRITYNTTANQQQPPGL